MAAALQAAAPIFALFLYDTYQLSPVEIGYVLSIYYASSFFSQMLVGVAVSGSRVYTALVAAFLIMSAGYVGLAFSPSASAFIIVSIFLGLGSALNRTTQVSAATMLYPTSKIAESMRDYTTLLGLGFTTGPALGTAAVGLIGVRNTMLLPGLLCLLGALIAARIAKLSSAGNTYPSDHKRPSLMQMLSLVKNRQVLTATLAILDLALVNSLLVAFAPIHARQTFHLQDSAVVSLFLGLGVVTFLSRRLIGKSLSRKKLMILMALGMGSATTGLLALAYSQSILMFTFGFLLLGLQQGLILPLGFIVVAGNTSSSQRVLGNAIGYSGQDAGRMLGPLAAAPLVGLYGIPLTMEAFSVLSMLVLAMAVLVKLKS